MTAALPGASPETMASAVATPLEKQFSTIAGIDSMDSTSAQGATRITLQFSLDRNIDAAAQDVQAAISRALKQLPPQMTTPPSFRKVNPADAPIFYLALTSTTLPLSTVDEYAQTLLAQRISTINGVAQVQVFGSQKYAVRVQLDPNALASRGIGIDEVAGAINRHNANLPTGTLYGAHRAYTVRIERPAHERGGLPPARSSPIATARRCGSAEIGRVIDSVENDKLAAWYNGKRGIVLADPAPARHQHHRGRGRDQEAAADLPRADPAGAEHRDPLRPLANRSANRCTTCSSRCCSRSRWW